MFEIEKLKKVVISEPEKSIKAMRDDFSDYVRHVFGTGTDVYLSQINQYENSGQHDLRKKHAIKNPWIIDELLRPIDNIWQAKGGDEVYTWSAMDKSEALRVLLSNVRDGLTLKDFMREIWLQRMVADPNGLIFLEATPDGEQAKLTYKAITSIHAYETAGLDVLWVVFEPDLVDEKGNQFSWAVDDQFYYRVQSDGKNVAVIDQIMHLFQRVPAVVCSAIFNTEKGYKVSLIDKQVDLLNSYLTKNSVKEIYQYLHNYPIFWMYQTICPTCNGNKKVGPDVCGTCNGAGFVGKKDVSDAFIVKKPSDREEPSTVPPAGYIQTDVITCEENRTELDWLFDKMFHSLWGTTVEKSDNETATGRFIDTMPVYNKLNALADMAQTVHAKLAEIIAKFYFPVTFLGAKISYSRRYIIESPDALWTRYQEAREKKAPDMALNYMLEQFYYSEFSANSTMADYYVKLMYVEPYVHYTIGEVDALSVPEDVKKAKRFFSEWVRDTADTEIIEKDVTDLSKMLIEYARKVDVQPINPINNGKKNE